VDTMKDTKMQPATDAVIKELRKVIADCYWPTPPVAINEILNRLEAAEKERDALRSKIETAENDDAHQKALAASALRVAEGWERKCGELRAKIAEMEQQGPVGKFTQHPSNGLWEQDGYGDNPEARPLYALPGAQGEKDVCMAETNFRPERRPSA